ncbi:MAG: hypothetical protein P8O16_14685 [Algoriphagus sp.]|uniref:hypothetical protein n=1 Tax=Algoriphagus sp. TaxID=1872435 RepID=UPI0026216422|nr:hypothetical protein [Algoriphagus sp.]MDG1278527.1 hypothetical protein [Algoriphagus sp.]
MKPYTISQNLILHFQDGKTRTFSALEIMSASTTISVKEWIKEEQKILLFSFIHSKLNTQLDLTEVSPFAILQFDEQGLFTGSSLSFGNTPGSFGILVQARKALVIPFEKEFPLESVVRIALDQSGKSAAEIFVEGLRRMPITLPKGATSFIKKVSHPQDHQRGKKE